MAFKLKRQLRYGNLRKSGFTPFESKEFSKVIPAHAPWLHQMIRERRDLLREFVSVRGNTRKKFETQVRREYGEKNWTRKMRVFGFVQTVIDPWKWYRAKRDEYVRDHPSWVSPGSPKTPKRPKSPTAGDRRALSRSIGMDTTRGSDEARARGLI